MIRKLVYTVATNSGDLPKIRHESNTDYYCFTNKQDFQSLDWKIKYINDSILSDQNFIKKYKILGDFKLEKKYDIVIYMDVDLCFHQSIDDIIKENCNFEKENIYFLEDDNHYVYQVSEKYIQSGIGNPAVIRTQMDYYKRQGFPKDFGLVSEKLIIRKKDKKLASFQEEWYYQLEQFNTQESLSIMYALWKCQIPYGVIHKDIATTEEKLVTKKANVFGNGFSNELGLVEEKNKYEPAKSNYHCHIEDINDSHSIIARRVQEESTVLDIGCCTGIIGELLFKNKKCVNYGIEVDEKSAEIAEKSGYYKKVFSIDIENIEGREVIEKEKIEFDYIILADVLEHMRNPADTLYRVSKWLSPTGKILISVPNVAYADIIKGLINEEFNYQKTGILDSTHLHAFTKNSFIEMIANLRITYQVDFDIEWLASTTYKEEEFILDRILGEEKYSVVQNIYEVSRLGKNEIPIRMLETLNKAKTNNYQKIVEELISYIVQEEQSKVIIQNLEEKNKILDQELKSIFQSKSWKMTEPLRKFSRTVHK